MHNDTNDAYYIKLRFFLLNILTVLAKGFNCCTALYTLL